MFFFITMLVASIGAAVVFISPFSFGKKARIYAILFLAYSLVSWPFVYCGLPSLAYPLLGWYGGMIAIFWLASAFVVIILSEGWSHSAWFPIAALTVILLVFLSGCEACNSAKFAGLIGDVKGKTQQHWSQEVQPLDPTHIRLVPKEVAIAMARTALSENGNTLGSQYPIDSNHCTLQKIKGDYYYLIPLDFKGYAVWTGSDGVPGYVRISAVDPYAKAELITGKKFKYTPEAFFGDNLERRLYSKYYNKILLDYSFEEDDNGKVYWVVTACHPVLSYSGLIVDGVIIFDPETGEDEYVEQSKLETNVKEDYLKYQWIDRVVPAEVVKSYINYWGDLQKGWWNSVWTHDNLLEGETPTVNYSADGKCVFVVPITSSNKSDQAMTGLIYMDARSGHCTYYTISGGATEEAIVTVVNSVVKYKFWHGSTQIVYENIYGEMTALVPILGESGTYQGLALVEIKNKHVAVGTTPQEALIEYQKLLMSSDGQISTETVKNTLEYTGTVKRLGWEVSGSGKQYYLTMDGLKNSFMVSSKLQAELSLTREGDRVYLKYIESNQASVPVMGFKNLSLNLQGSLNEQSVIKQGAARKEVNQTKSDVKDFKEKVKAMSDEEIQRLIKNK